MVFVLYLLYTLLFTHFFLYMVSMPNRRHLKYFTLTNIYIECPEYYKKNVFSTDLAFNEKDITAEWTIHHLGYKIRAKSFI